MLGTPRISPPVDSRKANLYHFSRKAFTAIELMVVMGIIILIIAIGVPAFNRISLQSRQTNAVQLMNSLFTRAYAEAIAGKTMTAVRLMPAAWDQDASQGNGTAPDLMRLQKAATYRWVTSYSDPNNSGSGNVSNARYDEHFERLIGGPEAILPTDTWAAPVEVLADPNNDPIHRPPGATGNDTSLSTMTLNGRINTPVQPAFALDPNASGEKFFDADDFLIIFDPQSGLVPNQIQQTWRMRAYDPDPNDGSWGGYGVETCGKWTGSGYNPVFQRFNYTGVVIYRREPLLTVGTTESASPDARRDAIRKFGQAYFVNRSGGTLQAGSP